MNDLLVKLSRKQLHHPTQSTRNLLKERKEEKFESPSLVRRFNVPLPEFQIPPLPHIAISAPVTPKAQRKQENHAKGLMGYGLRVLAQMGKGSPERPTLELSKAQFTHNPLMDHQSTDAAAFQLLVAD